MGLFDNFFGKSASNKDSLDDKPPIYGDDGTTEENATVINCASMGVVNLLFPLLLYRTCQVRIKTI